MFIKAEKVWIVRMAGWLSDRIYHRVKTWAILDQNTVGSQVIRSSDSVGANLMEGLGRHHARDALRFFYIARGSLEETRNWLNRAHERHLLDSEEAQNLLGYYQKLSIGLNAFIKAHKTRNHLP